MSFQQALSGLNATSKSLEVIGNNIANANTFGAKSSRAEFADMYAAALNSTGGISVGMGVMVATVSQQFSTGNITPTENPMDVAINGAGFFQLEDATGARSFSRNGQFKVDNAGYIVSNTGLRLMGHMPDSGELSALRLPTGGIPAQATSEATLEFNLDKDDEVIDADVAMDFDNPASYGKRSTSQTVYNEAGQAVTVSYYFRKTDADTWEVYATADGESIGGTNDDPEPVTTLEFNPNGTLSAPTDAVTLPINNTDPAISLDVDFSGATQNAGAYAVTDLTQNGWSPGSLRGLSIDPSGVMMANYTNGQSRPCGDIELVNFRNPQGLQPIGGNGWRMTYASGPSVPGAPGTGALGALQSGALEESNVDLTGELVSMITAQRNYQANAQTIKTMDQVMQTLVNLR